MGFNRGIFLACGDAAVSFVDVESLFGFVLLLQLMSRAVNTIVVINCFIRNYIDQWMIDDGRNATGTARHLMTGCINHSEY